MAASSSDNYDTPGRDFEYENNNRGYCCINKLNGVKCKNYLFCKAILPEWWYDTKGRYICTNCDMMFRNWGQGQIANITTDNGELSFELVIDCPVCLKIDTGVSYPH